MNDLAKLTTLFRHLGYGARFHPARDWYLIVAVGLVLLVASFFWNTALFVRTTEGQQIGVVATTTPAFAPASIQTVTNVFSARSNQSAEYQNGNHFVDPSAPGS